MLRHFSLGPVLSPRVDAARATDPLKRSGWEHGVVAAAQAFEQPRSGYGALQASLGVGVGVAAGATLAGLPLFVQFLIGVIVGLASYWAVPTAWAAVAWLYAPTIQRDEAREYVRALEAYNHDFEQWAARREIAFRFRHDTLEDVRRISADILMGSLSM